MSVEICSAISMHMPLSASTTWSLIQFVPRRASSRARPARPTCCAARRGTRKSRPPSFRAHSRGCVTCSNRDGISVVQLPARGFHCAAGKFVFAYAHTRALVCATLLLSEASSHTQQSTNGAYLFTDSGKCAWLTLACVNANRGVQMDRSNAPTVKAWPHRSCLPTGLAAVCWSDAGCRVAVTSSLWLSRLRLSPRRKKRNGVPAGPWRHQRRMCVRDSHFV